MSAAPEQAASGGVSRPIRPLRDVRVLDLTTGIAGPYCTRLFADAGAEIVKLEPEGGDPLRSYAATIALPPNEDGALFRYLNAGKKSLVHHRGDERLEALVAASDLVVDDGTVAPLDAAALRARHPRVVFVSITPFGRSGPLAGRVATDLTLQAESGAIKFKGDPSRPPVQAGGRISEFMGGLFAAPPALAAILRARETGEGESIDVSLHDVMAVAGSNYIHVMHEIQGRPPIEHPMRYLDTPGIEVAKDGLVGFNTNAGEMFRMFMLMVDRPDLMDDADYAHVGKRLAMGPAWHRIVDDWVGKRSVDEVVELAAALRIPVARVHDGASVLGDEHLLAREVFVRDGEGGIRPRPPYRLDGETMGVDRPAPRLGEHDDEGFLPSQPASTSTPTSATSMQGVAPSKAVPPRADRRPLAGLKVLDLTAWWVGALATQNLAMLGADVIHVEGVGHPDGMRLTGWTYATTPDWWEWGHMFAAANAGKRAIALDLAKPDGRALLDRLIDWADVFVENFSPRVAESFGLTREAVLARNPKIVYQRMPAYGLTGPWRDRPAFAQTIEPMSTMASITGHPDERPVSKGGLPDPVAGTHGTWALLVAIAEQRRRSAGVFCESVMLEAALNVSAQPLLERSAYGETMKRLGNRSPHAAPQGVYSAIGADAWVAVSVVDDEQWSALARAIGGDALATDPRYATQEARYREHDALDRLIEAWTAARDPEAAADALSAVGVPAAVCRDPRTIDAHPQHRARGLFCAVDHPVLGRHHVPGIPVRYASVQTWLRTGAPTFGRDNREVLRDLFGLADAEIDRLEAAGVIASRPAGL